MDETETVDELIAPEDELLESEFEPEGSETGETVDPASSTRTPTESTADEPPALASPSDNGAAATGWRDRLSNLGVPVSKDATDDQVMAHVVHLYRQAQQQPELLRQAELGRQYQAMQAAQQQAAQQAQQKKEPKHPWKLSEYDPTWEDMLKVERDPVTGESRVVPVNPYIAADLPQKYQAYHQSKQEALDQFLSNPLDKLMDGGLQDRIQEQIDAGVRRVLSQRDTDVFIQQAVAEDRPWIFQQANGEIVRDPVTGDPMLTPKGEAYTVAIAQLANQGIHDPQTQRHFGRLMAEGMLAGQAGAGGQPNAAPAPEKKTPAQLDADRKAALLEKGRQSATRNPNRSGTLSPTTNGRKAPAQKKKFQSLEDRLNEAMAGVSEEDISFG